MEEKQYYCTIGVTGGTASGGIDPANCSAGNDPTLTLDAWKQANGFPASGYPDAHAIYGNLGDLRIGRDMNCIRSGATNIACYVTNYGEPPFTAGALNRAWAGTDAVGNVTWDFPRLEAAIDDAIQQHAPFATVAMVYNPTATTNAVTFYTFDQNGDLLLSPALDGEGPKTAPRMCMACHGGTYDANTHSATGALFLPFDVYLFKHSNAAGYTFDEQQEAFRKLNALVMETNPPPAITGLITGMYPDGVTNVGSTAIDSYVPTGWAGQEKLYSSVVKQYCRMCHVASRTALTDFQQFKQFAARIEQLVCDTNDMPNAQVPFTRFWVHDTVARMDLQEFLLAEGFALNDLHDCKQ